MKQTLLALAFLPCVAVAQQIQHETLTGAPWSHAGTSSEWMEDVADTTAEFGKVDRLKSTKNLSFTRSAIVLEAGTYVATVRFKKTKDASLAAPLTLEAKSGSANPKRVVTVAEQTVDKFIHSKALILTLSTKRPVVFSLHNTDSKFTKGGYDFDSFSLGKVDPVIGKAQIYESITRRWGKTYGRPHVTSNFKDKESPFGVVDKIENSNGANLWWANWASRWFKSTEIRPGWYTANVRLKKTVNASFRQDWDFWVTFDIGGNKTNSPILNMKRADQPIGKWALTPNLVFFVRDPRTLLRFHLRNTRSNRKADYHLGEFVVRRGVYEPFGTGCRTSLGVSRLRGNVPQLGELFQIQGDRVPTVAVFWFGGTETKIDLTAAGARGCTLYTPPLILQPIAAKANVATLQFPFPADTGLVGLQFLNQALFVDKSVNPLGASFTNGARARVIN